LIIAVFVFLDFGFGFREMRFRESDKQSGFQEKGAEGNTKTINQTTISKKTDPGTETNH